MKKSLIVIAILVAILAVTGMASAWGRHHGYRGHSGFGLFVGPPAIWSPPGYYRSYYPPPAYYGPGYYGGYGYESYGSRAWVPGHWERKWGPYGWERGWIPGYWRY